MEDQTTQTICKKRVRDDDCAESKPNSPECKRVDSKDIKYDILKILDESEPEPEIQDLDSFIKSFEEEIIQPCPVSNPNELGFLLEASDDELGLPPAVSPQFTDEGKVESDAFGFGESLGFENEMPSYDPFGFSFTEANSEDDGEFVTVGGLFDYSDFSWQHESLPAL